MSVPAVAVAREPAVAPTSRSGGSGGFADVLATVSADAPSRGTAGGPARNRPAQDRPAQDRHAQEGPARDRPTQERRDVSDRPADKGAADPASEVQTSSDQPVDLSQTSGPAVPTAPVAELPVAPSVDLAAPQVPVGDQAAAAPVATVPVATEAPVPAAPVVPAAQVLADAVTPLGSPSPPQVGGGAVAAVPAERPTGAPGAVPSAEAAEPTMSAPTATTTQAATPPPAAPTATTTPPVLPPAAAPDTMTVAPSVPTVAPAPTTPVVATAAPAPPAAPPSPPLADQLGGSLRALVGARAGTHVLSIALDPQNLGEVRIVAHISADQVRIDLAGANDAARAALRGTLDDLRRDLQSSGLTAELGLADEGRQHRDGSPRRNTPTGVQTTDGHGPDGTDADPAPADPVTGHELDLVI